MSEILKIQLPAPGIEQLRREARDEGFEFVETLVNQWATGENRFDKRGEVLCGCMEQGMIVAVGGVNRDPFANSDNVGRIRRVYVRPEWRKQGIGRALVSSLVEDARKHFRRVRLRSANPAASRLYESLGFSPISEPDATHVMIFE